MPPPGKLHERFIKRCLELALRGKGKTSPNPMVGCVIVKNGEIIAEGWHDYYGGDHAEAMALKNAVYDVKGAELYCNLEPCCHTDKKTAPCLPLIIEAGIKKVIISNIDPNPAVSGRSVKHMREKGIEVFTDVLKKEDDFLNRFFYKSMREGMPFITVKIAQTLNGFISRKRNQQNWITGKKSMEYVHKMRSEYDAVLVGANTVISDNPNLTVRLSEGRNPIRIILDANLISSPDAAVFNDNSAETWLFYNKNRSADKYKGSHVRLFPMILKNGILNLKSVLRVLRENKIISVLVEGGQNIFSQFIEQTLFDEIIVIQSEKYFNSGIASVNLKSGLNLQFKEVQYLGRDLALIYGK